VRIKRVANFEFFLKLFILFVFTNDSFEQPKFFLNCIILEYLNQRCKVIHLFRKSELINQKSLAFDFIVQDFLVIDLLDQKTRNEVFIFFLLL